MNERKYNTQEINAYLLGILPETETERFDELSVTDDEFDAALKSAEKDLIDAYVQGELAGATLEKFKSHYLASPLRREKVNFAKTFQTFAEQNGGREIESLAFESSKPKRSVAGFFSALNVFKTLNPVWQVGFAAALLFMILGGLWIAVSRVGQPENQMAKQNTPAPRREESPGIIENQKPENSNAERDVARANEENKLPPNAANEPPKKPTVIEQLRAPKQEKSPTLPKPSIASFILAPSLRSGSQIPNLAVPAQTDSVAIRLELEPNDYTAYRVALVNQADENIWRSRTLKTKAGGGNKNLNIRFPANLLKSQVYSLVVSGINAGGEVEIISNYPFRAVVK